MLPTAVHAVCFSPTRGTRRCVRMLAGCFTGCFRELDLTAPDTRRGAPHTFAAGELAIVGLPVYCGRAAPVADFWTAIRGDGTPAVAVAVYGNRDFDDALLEMSDRLAERGFRTVGAVAMVAPHSYVPEVGAGRPDDDDRRVLYDFARTLPLFDGVRPPELPGARPYKPFPQLAFLPETGDGCLHCRICAKSCPVGAIADGVTDPARCLRCMACVRACPGGARHVEHPVFAAFQQRLGTLAGIRRPPRCFPPAAR